jgi:nucleotide-binding universal stress UspA family protein
MQEVILIPLDGSKIGESAIPAIKELVARIATDVKVEVTLLGVISILRHWVVVGEASAPISYTKEELEAIAAQVKQYLDKTAEFFKGTRATVSTKVRTGNAADEILKTADELHADIIAMSTHGRTGLSRLAFGSVTDKVLRRATKPVLTVRASEGSTNS